MNSKNRTESNSLPVVYSVLDKNIDALTKIWMTELKKNSDISDYKRAEEQSSSFLRTVLAVLKDGVFRDITSEELTELSKVFEALRDGTKAVGSEDISDTTNYLMSLKTAFLRFLPEIEEIDQAGDSACIRNEVRSFASLLDILGFLVVQRESFVNKEKINLLQTEVFQGFVRQKIIGKSKVMQDLFEKIEVVAGSDIAVLIEGQSGVGKELVAEAIHFGGIYKDYPFITVNCAAIPENLLESELFGYEKGAFTGADTTRIGKIEAAQGGTLFLDEIGEMPLEMQAKILRVLQNKEITRVGGNFPIKIDVRIISATNRNLREMVDQKLFREDLYYRLAVFPVVVPSLRERREDIALLAQFFLERESGHNKRVQLVFDEAALDKLMRYDYPGNIRELENVIKRAVLLTKTDVVGAKEITFFVEKPVLELAQGIANIDTEKTLEDIEKDIVKMRLDHFEGNVSKTAESLGVTRATVYKKIGRD